MTPVRVVIADDQPQVRTALRDLLATDPTIEVVGMARDATEVIRQCAAFTPDVVVMDVKMPGGGITATRTIRERHPETRVVAFSAYEDRSSVLDMLGAGATGYVTKGSPPAQIIAAVRQAGQGLSMLSPMASAELVQELGTRLRVDERHAADHQRGVERIQSAIRGDLQMVFQPIVDLSSGRLAGVEALARFGGQPPQTPDVWFAEAAQLGLGSPLERAALDAALPALDRIPEGAYLSVNVSPAVVMEPGFWDDVPPNALDRLVLEITEHAAVHDYERLRDVLAPLRARGLRLAVDDAGAGFASLRHILLLDADFIKIDITLIRDLHVDRARRALTSALITFATETRATVIAEGIEQADELISLRALGAAFGQGYLIARPASLDELDLGSALFLPAVSQRPPNLSSGPASGIDAPRQFAGQRAAVGDAVAVLALGHAERSIDTQERGAVDAVRDAFSTTLRHGMRRTDSCGRSGAEEFVVVLRATPVAPALTAMQRLAERWRAERPSEITFSAGVAAVDQRGFEAALAAAEDALRRAKATGCDRIEAAGLPPRVGGR